MDNKITFPELIELVAQATNTSKRMSELFLKELFATISQSLINGDSVKIKNLGTFKVEDVKPRKSVSVNTGQEVEIPSHKRLTFTPAKSLADTINEPFAHFETVMLSDDLTDEQLAEIAALEPIDDTVEELIEEPAATVPEGELPPVEIPTIPVEEPLLEEVATTVPEVEEVVTPPPFMPLAASTVPEGEEAPATAPVEEASTTVPEGSPEDEETPVTALVEEAVATVPEGSPEDEETPATAPVEEAAATVPEGSPEGEDDENALDNAPTALTYSIMEFEREKRRIARNSLIKGVVLGALGMLLIALTTWGVMDNGMFNIHTGEAIQADTLSSVDTTMVADTVATPAAVDTASVPEGASTVAPAASPAPQQVKAANKVVTDTTTRTLYLTRMAKKHYGHKDFWVYIYEENKAKISNPNTVPPGTILVIPPASKYGIDANNPESVKKAHDLQAKLFAQFATKKK